MSTIFIAKDGQTKVIEVEADMLTYLQDREELSGAPVPMWNGWVFVGLESDMDV